MDADSPVRYLHAVWNLSLWIELIVQCFTAGNKEQFLQSCSCNLLWFLRPMGHRQGVATFFFFFFKIFFLCGSFLKSLLNLLQHWFKAMFCFFGSKECGILAPWPGIKPTPHCIGKQSLSYRTTREVPGLEILEPSWGHLGELSLYHEIFQTGEIGANWSIPRMSTP